MADPSLHAEPGRAGLWRLPFRWISPAGPHGRLTVLIFHRVHRVPDSMLPGEVTADSFRERLGWLREWFNVVPLEDAVRGLATGNLPERAASITFDDGYADNVDVALPILLELGLPATFFIATGYLGGGRMWNDSIIESLRRTTLRWLDLSAIGLDVYELGSDESRRRAIQSIISAIKYRGSSARDEAVAFVVQAAQVNLPNDLMMSPEGVRKLAAAGMGIGAHTVTHPILSRVDDASAEREMATSREALEGLVRQPVLLLAYPNGKPNVDYRRRHAGIARRLGFSAAFTTAAGAGDSKHSPFELPRFTPWGRTRSRWGVRLLRNFRVPIETASP